MTNKPTTMQSGLMWYEKDNGILQKQKRPANLYTLFNSYLWRFYLNEKLLPLNRGRHGKVYIEFKSAYTNKDVLTWFNVYRPDVHFNSALL